MVIHAIETYSIGRVEHIVGHLIDLFNSDESRKLLENKRQRAREGLLHLQQALDVSLYEGMHALRQLNINMCMLHSPSGDSAVSRFQTNAQNLHYLLTRASVALQKDSPTSKEKVREIWDGITKSLMLEEDELKLRENMKKVFGQLAPESFEGTSRSGSGKIGKAN